MRFKTLRYLLMRRDVITFKATWYYSIKYYFLHVSLSQSFGFRKQLFCSTTKVNLIFQSILLLSDYFYSFFLINNIRNLLILIIILLCKLFFFWLNMYFDLNSTVAWLIGIYSNDSSIDKIKLKEFTWWFLFHL